jgi:hypothetical protein
MANRSWWYGVLLLAASGPGCDDKKTPTVDRCPELVAMVKTQCGEDSDAFKKHKQIYLDNAPVGEATSEADAQMRERRLRSCEAGIRQASEALDYSVMPDFSVGNDAELKSQAEQAKKYWLERKAAYEKMSPEDQKKDEALQLDQRCRLWVFG